MRTASKRLFPRNECFLPIQYRTAEGDPYRDALLRNSSRTGMYFELLSLLAPDKNIQIRMATDSPAVEKGDRFQLYLAQTIWCRRIPGTPKTTYGCGVMLLQRSHDRRGDSMKQIRHACDICGVLIRGKELRQNEEFIHLCSSCQRHLDSIPEGLLKQSIKRHLIGNVL